MNGKLKVHQFFCYVKKVHKMQSRGAKNLLALGIQPPVVSQEAKQTVKITRDQVDTVVSFLAGQPVVICKTNQQECSTFAAASDASSSSGSPAEISLVESSTSESRPADNDEIWIKNAGKPSTRDIEARDDLISLYRSDKYKLLFSDKKSTKKNVWEALGKEMVMKGYNFGDRDAGKVCAQKWRNMEGETLKVIAAAGPKNSGGGAVKKPSYFDDIHDIVKDKAKANPKNLVDSLDETTVRDTASKSLEENEDGKLSDEEQEKPREDTTSRNSPFLQVKSSSHPKRNVNNTEILKFLKSDAEKRVNQNKQLLDFLQKKAKQDDKRKKSFLSVLQTIAGKKRKSASLDEDSSSAESED